MPQAATALLTLEPVQPSYSANIHHYFVDPKTGAVHLDDDGEPLLGFYYEIVDLHGTAVDGLMGPYGDPVQAERACIAECRAKGYI